MSLYPITVCDGCGARLKPAGSGARYCPICAAEHAVTITGIRNNSEPKTDTYPTEREALAAGQDWMLLAAQDPTRIAPFVRFFISSPTNSQEELSPRALEQRLADLAHV